MNTYTHETVSQPGWYWFVPENTLIPRQFRELQEWQFHFPKGNFFGCLSCRGSYHGPIDTKALESLPPP